MSKHKSVFRAFIFVIIVGGIILGYTYFRYQYLIETPVDKSDTENISLVIKGSADDKADTIKTIAQKLSDKNLILDKGTFELYIKLNKLDRKIKAGSFVLSRSMNIIEIVEKLSHGQESQIALTIPEGFTVEQIDKKLTELNLITSGDFLEAIKNFDDYTKYGFLNKEKTKKIEYPLEGFLFPDTYFLHNDNFQSKDLIDMMLQNFENKYREALLETSQNQTDNSEQRNIFEIITMASIIEKEERKNEERSKVAGILWKRIDNGMMLGADATLLYLKQDRTITYQDLQENSPYNTRKFHGLPPGPIGNPGIASIKAALNPEDSPYFFYLHRQDNGDTIYSRTNEEHNENKRKYLQ